VNTDIKLQNDFRLMRSLSEKSGKVCHITYRGLFSSNLCP